MLCARRSGLVVSDKYLGTDPSKRIISFTELQHPFHQPNAASLLVPQAEGAKNNFDLPVTEN